MYKCKNQNAQNTILLVLYRCKTWSFTFKKDSESEFENRVMKEIFGRNGETVTTGSRNIHNEKLHISHYSLNRKPSAIVIIKSGRRT
jgi:hypothetical protein